MSIAHHINEQAARVNLRPTEGQKKAGNYRKGHILLHGLHISIENPRGSWRSGTALDGKAWRAQLPHHYGYIKRTLGADGDHVDVFVGPHVKSPHVFAIDQHKTHGDRGFDEHKIMLGFASEAQARKAYIRAFTDGKGAARIGHIEHMTIDAFKDWLRTGDTRKAIKHRAAGGGVGAPAFDPSKPFDPVDAPAFDPTKPFEPADAPPDAGKLDAALRGLRAGATFNMGDEIEGARASAPGWVPDILPTPIGALPAKTMVGAARGAYDYLTGSGGEGAEPSPYVKARDEARKNDEAAKTNHPYIYAGSELAGAVPAMAALPELGAAKGLAPAARGIAKFGARTLDAAVTGGEYGALSGAGEGKDTAERAVDAASGLVTGIIGGAGGNMVGEAVGALGSRYLSPAVQTVRGWANPNAEAARRVAGSLKGDQDMIQAGTAKGLSWPDWLAARQRGEPVTLADLGAGRTQSMLRSSANTSPEARAQIENTLEPRFHQQSERVADTVRKALPGGEANADKTAAQIVAQYDLGRAPAYKQAYDQGDRPLMSPAMERMMSSDMFVGAMKRAISSGKDRDVVNGLGGFNPMVKVTPDGRIVFNRGANGAPTYPNLQYWDQVKRELDRAVNMAKRSGDNETVDVGTRMVQTLRGELDRQVPSYAKARGIAETYFGESNALEAGQALAGKKLPPEKVRQILAQMKPDERALFQEGYASDLANRVIGSMKDTDNITKGRGLMQSPNERKMINAIFGPGGAAQIQARMHLETIMDGARQAMGNSTTARQLIEAGLAGGVAGGFASGWDPTTMGTWGAGALGSRAGAGKLISEEAKVGLKHMIGKVDARTARRVAELLTSNDPRLLAEGYKMAAKSQAIMNRLQAMARRFGVTSQTTASGPAADALKQLSGAARADDQGNDRGRLYVSPQRP